MMNIQGIDPSACSNSRHKLTSFVEEHVNNNVTFISFSETWLKPHITNAQIHIPSYEIVRQDRINRERGGVLLYVHNQLPTSDIETFDDGTCESVICSLKSINTIMVSLYRPPNTPAHSFQGMLNFLQQYISKATQASCNRHYDLIITGDFNLPNLTWHQNNYSADSSKPTESEDILIHFMEENLLCQYISQPTRHRNILDLFLTNNPNLVLQSNSTPTPLSDHNIVTVQSTYNLNSTKTNIKLPIPEDTFRGLNLFKADWDKINSHLESVVWEDIKSLCSADEFPELLRLTVLQVCMLYTPPKRNHTNCTNPFQRERNILRRRKRKLKRRISDLSGRNIFSHKEEKLRAEIYDLDEKIKKCITNQQESREAKALENIKENPRYFYSYAKQFSKQASTVGPLLNESGSLEHKPKAMADILQHQYSSVFSDPSSTKKKSPNLNVKPQSHLKDITFTCEDIVSAINEISEHSACGENDIPAIILKKCKSSISYPILLIWEESLRLGYVPKLYKNQFITPVHKKDSKAEAANYRPISLTSHIIKIFERIIRKHLVAHLEKNKLICSNQHGFRKHRSCLTQLLVHIDTILQNLQNGVDTDVIYLDYAKAFDKVDHELLLKKLYGYGVRGKLLMWLNSYLSNRQQTVVVNGEHSIPAKVVSGVPQGTVLGPVLFILYLNDLESCIKHSIISSFADDTRLKKAIQSIHDTKKLQDDLDSTIEWSERNNMQLHQSKFELLTHSTGRAKLMTELPFSTEFTEYSTQDQSVISPKPKVRDLGVTITEDLSWSPHINNLADDGKKISSWILSVFKDRSANTMLPLYKTLVRSRLEYCSPLWNPAKVEDIMKLENLQRTLTAKITEVRHLSYWERLKSLELMSTQRRRERYIIIHVYKILHELAPNDISMQFHQTSRRGICCKVPGLVKNCRQRFQTMYDNSFAVTGSKLWNLVPANIKLKQSLDGFKRSLSKFIMTIPDHPPVTGIPSQNSLLHLLATSCNPGDGSTVGGLEVRSRMSREDEDEI